MLTRFVHMSSGYRKTQTGSKGSLSWESTSETIFGDGCKGELTSFAEFPCPYYYPLVFFHVFSFSVFLDYRGRI